MKLVLDGKWKLHNDKLNIHLDVTVPGSVYHDLYENNIIPDPYYRDNEYKVLKYMEYDYDYIKEFTLNETNVGDKHNYSGVTNYTGYKNLLTRKINKEYEVIK